MDHILAATDLSALSLDAVARARLLASAADADLSVLHALGSDLTSPLRDLLGDDIGEQAERAATAVRESLGDALEPTSSGRPVDLVVEAGQPGTVVPAYARGAEADLVVLGARGAGTLHRMLFGSTASHLLRQCDVPVLVVKTAPAGPYGRVLVAVDRSPASRLLVELVGRVAPDAQLVLLHVTSDAATADDLVPWAAEVGLRTDDAGVELREAVGDPAEQILAHAAEHACDLVAMGKHGTAAREEKDLGSVTKAVVEGGTTDVLVLVDPARPE